MYFAALEAGSGRLLGLQLVPMQMKRMRAQRAGDADARWLRAILDREGRRFGTWTEIGADRRLELRWRRVTDARIPSP